MIGRLPPTQVLHMLALAYAIPVSLEMGGPIDWHYHHPDDGEPPVRVLSVRVEMVEDLPAMNGACAAMLGLILPLRGPVA